MMRPPKRLVSAVLALELFMAVLQLLDAFHILYYPMIHRWNYYLRFDLGFSLVPALLPISSVTSNNPMLVAGIRPPPSITRCLLLVTFPDLHITHCW